MCKGYPDVSTYPTSTVGDKEWIKHFMHNPNEVAFKQRDKVDVFRFKLDTFLVNGKLPLPAG